MCNQNNLFEKKVFMKRDLTFQAQGNKIRPGIICKGALMMNRVMAVLR